MSIRTVRRRSFAAGAAALAVAPAARAAEPPWIDAHTHVFLRGLPMAIDARYRPDHDASWETLLALAEKNGVGRAVILQPSFLGFDNSYLFETLRAAARAVPRRALGVAVDHGQRRRLGEPGADRRARPALPDLRPADAAMVLLQGHAGRGEEARLADPSLCREQAAARDPAGAARRREQGGDPALRHVRPHAGPGARSRLQGAAGERARPQRLGRDVRRLSRRPRARPRRHADVA